MRAILPNPRYTGRQVWNRQSRCQGHARHRGRRPWTTPRSVAGTTRTTRSGPRARSVHPALVDRDTFARVQGTFRTRGAVGKPAASRRSRRRTTHPPPTSGRTPLTGPVTAFLSQTGHPRRGGRPFALGHDGTERVAATSHAEANAPRGLRLTNHWDQDTVIVSIPAQAEAGPLGGGESGVNQAKFVVG
ncbi:recombinase family protein [Asanoa iriomotensis]|uniref:recombinase family protein n=1 Tax=Asanoa iriomotensis TaxID=234613 RepID=UPI0019449696